MFLSLIIMELNRPSSAISPVFNPTSIINGIASDENTSSAFDKNINHTQFRRTKKNRNGSLPVFENVQHEIWINIWSVWSDNDNHDNSTSIKLVRMWEWSWLNAILICSCWKEIRESFDWRSAIGEGDLVVERCILAPKSLTLEQAEIFFFFYTKQVKTFVVIN